MTARQRRRAEIAQPERRTVTVGALVEGLKWQDFARCAEVDPEIFFPEPGQSVHDPRKICRNCEVRVDCLESALRNGERYGFWGGLSERERRKIQRQREAQSGPHDEAAPQPEPALTEEAAPEHPSKRRVTVSQLAEIRARRDNGETITGIADDLGFSRRYLSQLLSGDVTPAPDPVADNAPPEPGEAGKVAA